MWRSIVIYGGEHLRLENDWLVIHMPDGNENRVPLSDLYCVVIDNPMLTITVQLMSALAKHKIQLVTTDEKHMPVAMTYPINANYRCYKVLKKQLDMTYEFKGGVWRLIVEAKIMNQSRCLSSLWADKTVTTRLEELSKAVDYHDRTRCEGIAARIFFQQLYGSDFVRHEDTTINNALDYGYAIMRSGVAKSLVAHGFNCVLGVHHIGETNDFNLADDFIEPLRPIIDQWVAMHPEDIEEGLTKYVKNSLVDLLNAEVLIDSKKVKVRYAIDIMARSFVTAIETNNPSRLLLPEIIIYHEK